RPCASLTSRMATRPPAATMRVATAWPSPEAPPETTALSLESSMRKVPLCRMKAIPRPVGRRTGSGGSILGQLAEPAAGLPAELPAGVVAGGDQRRQVDAGLDAQAVQQVDEVLRRDVARGTLCIWAAAEPRDGGVHHRH